MQRSHCFALLTNSAPDDEIAQAITPDARSHLMVALESVLHADQPASDEALMAELTAFAGLVGQDWQQARRAEFLALATRELRAFPGALVLDALRRARIRVTAGRLLVAWVVDDVEAKADALKLERSRLTRLAEIASATASKD